MDYTITITDENLNELIDDSVFLISYTHEHMKRIFRWFRHYRISHILPSCTNNFKDAMMHLRKMCTHLEEVRAAERDELAVERYLSLIVQRGMMIEHLTRAIVDAHTMLAQSIGVVFKAAMNHMDEHPNHYSSPKSIEYRMFLSEYFHKFKDHLIKLRLSKMDIYRFFASCIENSQPEGVENNEAFCVLSEGLTLFADLAKRQTEYLTQDMYINDMFEAIYSRELETPVNQFVFPIPSFDML